MIIKNNKSATERDRALFWVAEAATMDEAHHFMKSVLFIDSPKNHVTAVATDGRRLHMAVFPETCKDYWDVHYAQPGDLKPTSIEKKTKRDITLGSVIDHPFPNYQRVIPEDLPYHVYTTDFFGPPEFFHGSMLVAIQDAGHRIPRFKPYYIDRVAEAPIDKISFETPEKAFRFDAPSSDPFKRMAVIMPLQRLKP